MIDFLWNNKEWLFSGIGVFVIAAVISFFLRRRTLRQQRSLSHQDLQETSSVPSPVSAVETRSDSGQHSQSLTPQAIVDSVTDLPLLLQEDAAGEYYGIGVQWYGMLIGLNRDKNNQDIVLVHLKHSDYGPAIMFKVKLSENPGLGTLKKGTQITVKGTIKKIQNLYIELENARIIF